MCCINAVHDPVCNKWPVVGVFIIIVLVLSYVVYPGKIINIFFAMITMSNAINNFHAIPISITRKV